MKALRLTYLILQRTTLAFVALLIVLGIIYRIERTPLPNGMQLGLRYIWDREDEIYLWTKNGTLAMPYSIHWMCFSDRFVEGTFNKEGMFVYDIEEDIMTLRTDEEYGARKRASDLFGGCNGYTTYLVGPQVIVDNPSRYLECTLSNPCQLDW